jgi:uncharacterized protein YbjT (DUF2867 family)
MRSRGSKNLRIAYYCAVALQLLLLVREAQSFATAPLFAASTLATEASSAAEAKTKDVVTKVAVAGATGRTGRLVVEDLLRRGVPNVVALVRDGKKAEETFPNKPENLEIVQCDLTNEEQIDSVLTGVDAAIWCATGFSNAPTSPLEKIKQLLGMVGRPEKTIDVVGLPAMAKSLSSQQQQTVINGKNSSSEQPLPKLIMCSSAGVTRPAWSQDKKERFPGAADIPIVRLNPFGILDRKRESEEKLRQTGIDYCILRPCGLNDDWPVNSRPIFSQGDVAVGRINRSDVAKILVDLLSTPEATGKTFEVIALAGYPRPVSPGPALERLYKDSDKDGPSDEMVAATYAAMQQLLPGEKQDSAGLAMGQTYEELDQGMTGRLGVRGEENAEAAAPKPSSG